MLHDEETTWSDDGMPDDIEAEVLTEVFQRRSIGVIRRGNGKRALSADEAAFVMICQHDEDGVFEFANQYKGTTKLTVEYTP